MKAQSKVFDRHSAILPGATFAILRGGASAASGIRGPEFRSEKLTPEWIPGRIFLSSFVGVILILAGACLLVNKKARTAATASGLTILLTVLEIYLPMPMLLAAPTDVVALNFFFDTLLFCGAILLLANSIDKEPAKLT